MKAVKGLFLGLLLSLVITRFFFLDHRQQIIGDGGDNYEYFAFQNLVKENLENGQYPLAHTNTLRYPIGFNLGLGYDGVFAVFTGATLGLFLSSGLAYNLSVVLILTLNFFSAYWLTLKISRSSLISFLAGITYGFSPYVFARINSHLNLAFVAGLPFLIYSLVNFYQKGLKKELIKGRDIAWIFFSLLLVAWGSLQYLILTTEVLLISLFLGNLFFKEKAKSFIGTLINSFKTKGTSWLISLFVFSGTFLLFYYQYILAIVTSNLIWLDKLPDYLAHGRPRIIDLLIPNGYLGKIWGTINPSFASIEKVATPGIVAWLLSLLLLIKQKNPRKKFLYLIAILSISLLILGYPRLPLLVESGRWVIILNLLLLALIIQNSKYLSKPIITFFCLLLLLERLSFSIYASPLFPEPTAKIIRNSPGEAALNIPLSKYSAYYSAFPFSWQKKIIDGYFHFTADNNQANQFLDNNLINRYICQEEKHQVEKLLFQESDLENTLRLLKDNNIRTIVLHKNPTYSKFLYDQCDNVRYWWYNLNPETIKIEKETTVIEAKTVELTGYQNFKVKLYFPLGGNFNLVGFSIFPNFLTDSKVTLPQEKVIYPDWELKGENLATANEPLISLSVKPGEEIIISSQKEIKEPIYFTLFYQFENIDKKNYKEPPIKLIFQNESLEVFVVN